MVRKRGPQTEAGRLAVRYNALKFGIFSETPVIEGIETEKAWQQHLKGVSESLAPQDYFQSVLVRRIAMLQWRMARAEQLERNTVANAQDSAIMESLTAPDDVGFGEVHNPSIVLLSLKAMSGLLQRLTNIDDVTEWSFLDVSLVADAFSAFCEADGSPTLAQLRDISQSMDGGEVRRNLEVVATELQEDLAVLLTRARDGVEEELAECSDEVEVLERRRDRIRRVRLLADDATMEKVIRYESHLHRHMLQLMHELESMQQRRQGPYMPPARLDVIGESEFPHTIGEGS